MHKVCERSMGGPWASNSWDLAPIEEVEDHVNKGEYTTHLSCMQTVFYYCYCCCLMNLIADVIIIYGQLFPF